MEKVVLMSEHGMFKLIEKEGVGIFNTPWHGLEVKSYDLASKHVVDIRLDSTFEIFNGTPVKYEYRDATVAHGMRGEKDSLEETEEYIEVLKEAINFAKGVKEYIHNKGWELKKN